MTLEQMRENRTKLYKHYLESAKNFHRCERLYKSLLKRFHHDEEAYRKAEYEIACLDGRKQKLEPKENKPKVRKESLDVSLDNLTDEQKLELAELLGLTEDN